MSPRALGSLLEVTNQGDGQSDHPPGREMGGAGSQ